MGQGHYRLEPLEVMDIREKIWHGLRAASLSVMPGAGHLYIGEKRGYTLLVSALTLLLVSRLIWPPAELFYLSLAIFSAFDVYATVKRGYGLI